MPGTTSNGMPCALEEFEFLAAAPEDERVAALEADDAPADPRVLEQQFVDAVLRHRVTAGHLADADAVGIAPGEVQDLV